MHWSFWPEQSCFLAGESKTFKRSSITEAFHHPSVWSRERASGIVHNFEAEPGQLPVTEVLLLEMTTDPLCS